MRFGLFGSSSVVFDKRKNGKLERAEYVRSSLIGFMMLVSYFDEDLLIRFGLVGLSR